MQILGEDQRQYATLAINRNNMVFGSSLYKDFVDRSLSKLNSGENISITSQIIDVTTNKRLVDRKMMSTNNLHNLHDHSVSSQNIIDPNNTNNPAVNNFLPVLSTQQTPKPVKKLKIVIKNHSGHKRFNSSVQDETGILRKIRE